MFVFLFVVLFITYFRLDTHCIKVQKLLVNFTLRMPICEDAIKVNVNPTLLPLLDQSKVSFTLAVRPPQLHGSLTVNALLHTEQGNQGK